jgi:hypothetical protein
MKVVASAHPRDRDTRASICIIVWIKDPMVIKKILDHLKKKEEANEHNSLPESRAPALDMQTDLFD